MHSNTGFEKNVKTARFTFEEAKERIQAHKKKGSKRVNKRLDFDYQE